ncbi:hypothetical protein P152DRAFT_458895 [Eremomyces bilateralis CBS 781.70]|uniref:Uncharacterized protein n=1 Tax=Eremomyces bilateralis CBS 781.70 TaxID=1392243 RepID=A0A6G1G1P6_9PEZI|nr:uncharacterized protein P152DRAFT_458895 [Eremomyces bilateralis CBS 781.70]KAF1811938.1 hypothetical protein P152DRAFT_458895 [Eremomyces bilateralis CBS 781.70]
MDLLDRSPQGTSTPAILYHVLVAFACVRVLPSLIAPGRQACSPCRLSGCHTISRLLETDFAVTNLQSSLRKMIPPGATFSPHDPDPQLSDFPILYPLPTHPLHVVAGGNAVSLQP